MRYLLVLLLLIGATAQAELTYPVDHTAQWQRIDTNDCTTVDGFRSWPALDPDTYDCDTEPCGKAIDPPFPANYKMLRVQPAGPFPTYDSNLSSVQSPYLMCGPSIATCYDAECTATDVMQQVHRVVDLTVAQRKEALSNQASMALLEMIPENQRWRVLMLQVTMLSQLVDGASLPTNWQGLNWQNLYSNQFDQLKDAAQPVVIRYTDLLGRINATPPTIQDGEIGTGWPLPAE